jgi:hypothetical protein
MQFHVSANPADLRRSTRLFSPLFAILAAIVFPLALSASQDAPKSPLSPPTLLARLQWRPSEYFPSPSSRNAAIAIQKPSLDALRELHKQGLDVRVAGKHGVTLLFWAYLQGNFEAFSQLLDWGADPNSLLSLPEPLSLSEDAPPIFPGDSVALVIAANPRPGKWLERIVQAGGDVKFVSPKLLETLFSTVCSQKSTIGPDRFSLERLLLEKGADINHRNRDGRTPAMISFSAFDWPRVIFLLEQGASPACYDNRNWQLVHHVAFHKLMATEAQGAAAEAPAEIAETAADDHYKRIVELLTEKGYPFDAAIQDLKRRHETVDGRPYMAWRKMQRQDTDQCTAPPAAKAAVPQNR